MINAIALQKTYTSENVATHALQDITLSVRKGEFVAVMGPSGCGKSTLLHLLGLLDTPTHGTLKLLGRNVSNYSEKRRMQLRKGNIGFVFQSFNLIDDLTVYENVELPLVYLNYSPKQRRIKVTDILRKMGINHRKNYFPLQLSGGQQQRVSLARAIIAQPPLVLADEPTGNLDSINGEQVMQLLKELHKNGTTIVMVTHSSWCAEQADRTINLFDGCIVC